MTAKYLFVDVEYILRKNAIMYNYKDSMLKRRG